MPKRGHGQDEYEDACAVNILAQRFAIADGASESSFAGTWADLLVKGYTAQAGPWNSWLTAARQTWHERFKERDFSWYAEEKFLAGAEATFLGLRFKGQRWRAVAIGDCCLFHLRGNNSCQAFPVRHAGAFGNQPDLIGSRPAAKKIKRLHWRGNWHDQDRMLLMTDALAQWFLQKMASREQPWLQLLSLHSQKAFEDWVEINRKAKQLRNDDVTFILIHSDVYPLRS